MGNQATTPSPSSQNSPSAGFRNSGYPYLKTENSNEWSRSEHPNDLSKSYFELPQSSINAVVSQQDARQRQIVELHLSQSVSDLSLKNHLKREQQKDGSFIKSLRNRFKPNKESNKPVTNDKVSTKRPPKLRRAETECPALSRDGSCQQFLTIPSARSVNRLRSGGDSESDVSCSNRLQRRSNQMRSGSERSSSILDGCTSGTDLNSECSSRQSFELSSEYRRQHSFESNDCNLNPVKKSPRKWSDRKGLSLDDPSFDPLNQTSLCYVNRHFSSFADTDGKNQQNAEHRHKNSNLDSIKEAGYANCNEKMRKTVLIKPANAPKGHAKDKSFFDSKNLSKSISCYALKLLPSNSSYIRKHEQANCERPKLHRMSKVALDVTNVGSKSGDLAQKTKSRCNIKSAPLIQPSTGELLRYLANFVASRCGHLMGYPTPPNATKSMAKCQDPIGLQPIAIISWIRSIDRNLIVNGWSEIAFLNPSTVTFLYMLLKEYLSEDVNSEYELHSIVMTCLYLSYSYMGNEISYPLRPFIVAEMANRARKNRKLDSKNKRSLSASVSNMAGPTLACSYAWKSSVHYGDDVEGSINNLATAENSPSPSPGTNINIERDLFFDRCLRVMNERSADMLRINSDPNLFAQLLTELVSFSDYHLSKSPSKYIQKQIPNSPIVVGSIELLDSGSGRVKAYPKGYQCSRGNNAVQVSNTDANSTFST